MDYFDALDCTDVFERCFMFLRLFSSDEEEEKLCLSTSVIVSFWRCSNLGLGILSGVSEAD